MYKKHSAISLSSATITSIESFTTHLANLQPELTQLSKGQFKGFTRFIDLNGITMTHRCAMNKHLTSGYTEDKLTIFLPLVDTSFFTNGWLQDGSNFSISTGHYPFTVIFPQLFEHLILTIDKSVFPHYLNQYQREEFFEAIYSQRKNGIFKTNGTLARYMLNIFMNIMWHHQAVRSDSLNPETYSRLIIAFLFEQVCTAERKTPFSQSNYCRIVQRGLDCIEDNAMNYSIADLSRDIFACERSIHNAFRKILNMTPHEFIKAERLNKIKKYLAACEPDSLKINDMLRALTVTNISRFKQEYTDFFAESPEHTLGRQLQHPETLITG